MYENGTTSFVQVIQDFQASEEASIDLSQAVAVKPSAVMVSERVPLTDEESVQTVRRPRWRV